MSRLNYNHLFNFYSIAKAGSLKRAAIDLGLTQSTLSEQMKELEKRFRTKLFTREGRTLSLNAQGRRLFGLIETFYANTQSFADASLEESPLASRSVEIGITPAVSKAFSFQFLRPLFRAEDLHVRVTESSADSLLPEFKRQTIDVLLTHEKLSGALIKRLRSTSLREPEFVAVGAKRFKHLVRGFPESLSDQPFFLFTSWTPLRWEIDKFFRSKNIRPKIRGEVDDVDLLRSAAIDGLGLTLLPRRSVEGTLRERKLFELGTLPKNDIRIYAYYIGDAMDARVERVIQLLADAGTSSRS